MYINIQKVLECGRNILNILSKATILASIPKWYFGNNAKGKRTLRYRGRVYFSITP